MKSASAIRNGRFIHFPYRVYPEAGRFVACCDPLRVREQGATEDDALQGLARALHLYLRVSIARDSLPQLFDKLMQASPKRPIVSASSADIEALWVDRTTSELLLPLG